MRDLFSVFSNRILLTQQFIEINFAALSGAQPVEAFSEIYLQRIDFSDILHEAKSHLS